jgi:hypothetical protein
MRFGHVGETMIVVEGSVRTAGDRLRELDVSTAPTFQDWPQDVLAVADHLAIGRFGVLGYSFYSAT